MTFREFQNTLYGILEQTPFPDQSYWELKPLSNAQLRDNRDWYEVLYRTSASFLCPKGHFWRSSWHMIFFRFRYDYQEGIGRIRMRRFRQQCIKCGDDEYHSGKCNAGQVEYAVESLLLYIMKRLYEGVLDEDTEYYTIIVSDVPPRVRGNAGGAPHMKEFCEACRNNRCKDYMIEKSKRKL